MLLIGPSGIRKILQLNTTSSFVIIGQPAFNIDRHAHYEYQLFKPKTMKVMYMKW